MKAADSENNFLYHLFWFLDYNNEFKMHNNFKQTKSKRTGQSLQFWNILGPNLTGQSPLKTGHLQTSKFKTPHLKMRHLQTSKFKTT